MLELLLGNVVRLSQNHAFDSQLVLEASESDSFLSLIRAQRMQFALLTVNPGVKAAMQAALDRQSFAFSAWPNLEPGSELRAPAKEALGTGRPSSDLDDETQRKIEAVRRLDSAIAQAPRVDAVDARWRLAHLVRKSWRWLPRPVQAALSGKELPTARTSYYHLAANLGLDSRQIKRTEEVVDGCYNNVIASSVQAQTVMLTVTEPALERALAFAAPAKRIAPLVGFDVKKSELMETVQEISWSSVYDVLKDRGWQKPTRKDLGEVASYLAPIRLKSHTFYSIVTRSAGAVAGGLIWGTSALLGSWLSGGSPEVAIGAGAGAAVPALWAGDQLVTSAIRSFFTGRVEKRFYGIFEQRLVDVGE